MDDHADLVAALRDAGLVGSAPVAFTPLAGGVSCDIWRIDGLGGPLVIKRPLAKLRVAADWFAPVARSASEVRWLRYAHAIDPAMVPEVVADFPALNAFVLRFIPDCPVWKDELSAGRIDVDFAGQVGQAIGAVHAASAHDPDVRAAFADGSMFEALRINPFLLHVAEHNAAVAAPLREIAADLAGRRMALVHGDVSPKNILVGKGGPVILDAECAVSGDPAFDLAFCTTHLLLKAVWLDHAEMQVAAAKMIAAYARCIDWEAPAELLLRAGRLTAALLLARIEGKSPAPYLTDVAQRRIVAEQAGALLHAPQSIENLVLNWKRTTP